MHYEPWAEVLPGLKLMGPSCRRRRSILLSIMIEEVII